MRKGFTLIELLAVIVILAIIALIATPIILNVIGDTQEGSLEQSVNGLLRAANNYAAKNMETQPEDQIFYVKNGVLDSTEILVEGKLPSGGILYIRKDGKIGVALQEKNTCYKKGFEESEITITENATSCDLITEMEYTEKTIAATLNNRTIIDYTSELKETGADSLVRYDDNVVYFSGNVSNNYVWFGGHKWRIVSIDQAGNVKLVTDHQLTALSAGQKAIEYASLKDNYIGKWLTEDFLTNFSRAGELVKVGYSTPDINSENSIWLSKASLLTTEDCLKAGVYEHATYTNYYENSEYYSYRGLESSYLFTDKVSTITMLADIAYYGNQTPDRLRMRYLSDDPSSYDSIQQCDLRSANKGIRPVVTIPGNMIIVSGDGTASAPYVFEGENTATTVSTMQVGDYVKLPNNDLARLMAKDSTGYKFALDGYTEEPYGGGLGDGTTNQFTLANIPNFKSYQKITNYFNGTNNGVDLTNYLDTNEHNWYIGAYSNGTDYSNTLTVTSDYKGSYAFLRVAEMFSGAITETKSHYYLITPALNSTNKSITINGYSTAEILTSNAVVPRPAFYLRGDIGVTGGAGSYNNPYTIQ